MNIFKLKQAISKTPPTTKRPELDNTLKSIDTYVTSLHNPPYIPSDKFSHTPSILGTKCLRKIYYNYFKVEKSTKINAKAAKIFETGTSYEAMIMTWLKAIGEHIPYISPDGTTPIDKYTGQPNYQFPINIPDWRINKGFIDNIAVIDGKLWLYEIKSSNEDKFNELYEPKEEHKCQISCYFKAINEQLASGALAHIPALAGITEVTGIKVIYINKNNSELKLFAMEEPHLVHFMANSSAKISKVNEYIDKTELPPKTKEYCNYCPYKKNCDKDKNVLELNPLIVKI